MTNAEKINAETEALRSELQEEHDIPVYRWEHFTGSPGTAFEVKPGSTIFHVGKYTVRAVLEPPIIRAEWFPRIANDLNKKEWKEYRRARDAFMQTLGKGGNVMMVET